MSDNISVTPGAGATVAADDIGGILYQRVKVSVGAPDNAADLAFGAAAAASSLPVTQSTEDVARVGSLTETAPTTDTASSGLNGRLQRVAQRLSSLIGGIGGVSDTAWTTGDGSVISVLKSLASDTTAADVNLTKVGGTTLSAAAPVPAQLSQGGAVLSDTNPIFARKPKLAMNRLGTIKTSASYVTGAKVLDSLFISNQDAAAVWVQFFDVASGGTAPTLGTTTPVWEIDLGVGKALIMAQLGLSFANGIWIAVTTAQKGSTISTTGANLNLGTL
jgi:hypothetical protein